MYKSPGQHLSLGQVVELNRRFIEGYMHFKDEPRIQKLKENVLKYNRLVRDLGLRDHQVRAVVRKSGDLPTDRFRYPVHSRPDGRRLDC